MISSTANMLNKSNVIRVKHKRRN